MQPISLLPYKFTTLTGLRYNDVINFLPAASQIASVMG